MSQTVHMMSQYRMHKHTQDFGKDFRRFSLSCVSYGETEHHDNGVRGKYIKQCGNASTLDAEVIGTEEQACSLPM